MASVALTRANAARYRKATGNGVYAAERALPARHWVVAAQTDKAALFRACAPDTELVWVHGGGRGIAHHPTRQQPAWVSLGTRAPLFMAVHEAAHIVVIPDTGHGQRYVDAYVRLLREHAPPALTRALVTRLAWQGFTIPDLENTDA